MKKITTTILIVALVLAVAAPAAYAKEFSFKNFLGIGVRHGDEMGDDNQKDENEADDNQGDDNEQGDDNGGDHKNDGEIRADSKATIGASAKERAAAEIDRRIASLNKLETRVEAMDRVSDASKASLKATIDAQITVLTDLKAKIAGDDDAALKADIQSITKDYRIYMLVIPQGAILATADRINTTADLMTAFGTKLETRINDADTAGHDVSALNTAYADYKAKVADAKVQASAAVSLTADLKPDNGDNAVMQANMKAMSDARAKIKAARADLQAARKDAQTIVKGLKSFDLKVEGNFKSDSNSESNH